MNRRSEGSPKCQICNTDLFESYTLFDDRYGFPGTFTLFFCANCKHRLLDAPFTWEEIQNLYSNYYPRSSFSINDFSAAREPRGVGGWLNGEKRSAYAWVPKNVRVLDIGCGFGKTLAYHTTRGCDAYGVEADNNIRRVAEKFGFKVHVGLFDPALYDPGFFDYVTLDQVVEHFTNPVETLQGVAKVLRPGGTAILSTPNANGWGAKVFGKKWINWHAPYHLQHFSRKSMQIAAQKAGLELSRSRCITSSSWLNFQWGHLLTYPAEGTPSARWAPDRVFKTKKIITGTKFLTHLHRFRINHLFTRFFDALGVGDNYLFFLRKP